MSATIGTIQKPFPVRSVTVAAMAALQPAPFAAILTPNQVQALQANSEKAVFSGTGDASATISLVHGGLEPAAIRKPADLMKRAIGTAMTWTVGRAERPAVEASFRGPIPAATAT